jgi:hypothetical protein
MAVETSSDRDRSSQIGSTAQLSSFSSQKNGLLPGERVVSELSSSDDGSFQLTHARVIYSGGSESNALYASAQLKDITSVQISRRPRARRSAAWGVIGLFAAIGVWQVTPNSTVGITAAAMVAVISLVMMADYWIRPAGVFLEFHTTGGKIGGEVGGKATLAMEFAHGVEDAKRRIVPNRVRTPYRNYPSG